MAFPVLAVGGESIAGAAPRIADKSIVKYSDDGWKVGLTKSDEAVRSVPALSRGHGSYEAFLDLRGVATISGAGSSSVDSAILTTGFQVSCQWQFDGLQFGVSGGPSAQLSVSWPPAAIIGGQVSPSISTTLKNGVTKDVEFASKPLQGSTASARLEGVRIEISGCVGARPAVRSYVRLAMRTKTSDNTFSLYGKPQKL
ncbi:MspA family porin [Gordonia hydrophobica]